MNCLFLEDEGGGSCLRNRLGARSVLLRLPAVEARTLLLHVLVKAALLQQPVQLLVERMPHRPRQICVRNPKFLLSSLLLFSAHSHARILRTSAVDHTIFFLRNPDLHHGLLGEPRDNFLPRVNFGATNQVADKLQYPCWC